LLQDVINKIFLFQPRPSSSAQRPNILKFLSKTPNKEQQPAVKQAAKKVKVSSKPFLYLKQLELKKRKKAVVKASVISILRKLGTTNQKWSLLAKITDSTSFLDVELGNKVKFTTNNLCFVI